MAAQQQISFFFGEQIPLPFSPSYAGFPGTEKPETEVKEVTEEAGNLAAAPRTGSGSKRSRAAEVHNLSEKRRRSRINEKMRALQNLIPNSNKTDKASMLDEAIEYLKQLQLQVQMLSMRNGLSLHDMYLTGMVQPQQQPPPMLAPEICMGFTGDNRMALNMRPGLLPLNQESLPQNQQVSSSHHSVILPTATRLTVPQTSYGVESSQLPLTAEMLAEDMVLQQQLDAGPDVRDPTDVVKTTVPHFRGECLLLEDHGQLQIGVLGRDLTTQNTLPRDSNHQFHIHHLDGLQAGRSICGSDVKSESSEF